MLGYSELPSANAMASGRELPALLSRKPPQEKTAMQPCRTSTAGNLQPTQEAHRNNNLHPLVVISPDPAAGRTVEGRQAHITLNDFKTMEGKQFALMKYGSSKALDHYAHRLVQLILQVFPSMQDSPDQFVCIRPGNISLPTAATLLADRIQKALDVPMGRIVRGKALTRDFATLDSAEERAKAMQGLFKYSGPQLDAATAVFLIEDTVVSGSHYVETQRVLEQVGCPLGKVHCICIASVEGLSAKTESELNELYFNPRHADIVQRLIQCLKDVTEDSDPTSRQVKFILNSLPEERFSEFACAFAKEELDFQQWFLLAAPEDGLDLKYPETFKKLSTSYERAQAKADLPSPRQIRGATKTWAPSAPQDAEFSPRAGRAKRVSCAGDFITVYVRLDEIASCENQQGALSGSPSDM